MRRHVKSKVLTVFLASSLLFTLAYATVDVQQGIVFKTSSNNAQFVMGADFEFYKVEINSSRLWMDKTYSTKHYTRYCIYVVSPDDCQFSVSRWFATANSTGTLTITSPLSTNIDLRFYSPNLITASASGVVGYSWLSANKTLVMTCNSDVNPITISATVTETEETNTPPENYGVTITDMEGCGAWVFSEESYYTFQAEYWDGDGWADLDTCKIAFIDGVTWVNASYDVSASEYTLESGGDVVRLQSGTVTIQDSKLLRVTFLIYFINEVLDAYDVDIWMWCNDIYGAVDDWEIIAEEYFSIYNLGGHSTLTSNGDAGRLPGGDVFDLYAENNSWVEATVSFRNLQHIKMLPEITYLFTQGGVVEIWYQIDYCVGDDWVDGWGLHLEFAQCQGGGTRQYVTFYATWYQGENDVKTENISAYQPTTSIDTNSSFRFWIDLWFNKLNASSVGGGRVNAYYFPMVDDSNNWLRWLTGSNWGIDDLLKKQTMAFMTLLDSEGETVYASQIEMVKVKCKLLVNPSALGNVKVSLHDYDVFDLTIGGDPFIGIQTPVFDETKVPIMPQGGFLGSVVSWFSGAITWLADNLIYGGLNLWGHFVGFMDTIAGWLGFPNAFTNFITWLGSCWTWMTTSFGWLISLLTDTFSFLMAFMTKLINTVSTALGIFTSHIQNFFMILDSGWGSATSIWDTVGMTWWIIIFFILYPLFLLGMWEERGLDAVISHIKGIIDILAFIGSIFIRVIQLTLNVLGRIIESIPVVE